MLEELKQVIQDAGIIGAGGAGFPTYAKLAEGADTLVMNGAECESLIYSDLALMKLHMEEIIEGAEMIVTETCIERAILSMKAHTAKRLSLNEGDKLSSHVTVKVCPDVYPMGDEITLIYQSTGRLVQPGHLPISAGVIVMNVETIYNVREAVLAHRGVTEKHVTINGNLPHALVVKVPIGTRISELFQQLNITVPEGNVVIDGGPAMGRMINYNTATVTKTTKALMILPEDIPCILSKKRPLKVQLALASSVCCSCNRCTDLCPRHLLGYPLEPHKMVRSSLNAAEADPELVKTATLCCNCGICELAACCQGISPRAIIGQFRAVLAKDKIHFQSGDEKYSVRPEHDFRLLSSGKWKSLMGVAKFDKKPDSYEEEHTTKHVEIGMHMNIGAPAVPIVSVGEQVEYGQMIARAGEGLSVPQHASIAGKVTFVSSEKIIIDA